METQVYYVAMSFGLTLCWNSNGVKLVKFCVVRFAHHSLRSRGLHAPDLITYQRLLLPNLSSCELGVYHILGKGVVFMVSMNISPLRSLVPKTILAEWVDAELTDSRMRGRTSRGHVT